MIDTSNFSALMNRGNNVSTGTVNAIATGLTNMKGKFTDAAAEAAAKDFESMFLSAMLEPMFGDSLGSSLFGDDETQEVYKHMMMDQYGKQISQSGGIGIADYVKRELLKQQEVNP